MTKSSSRKTFHRHSIIQNIFLLSFCIALIVFGRTHLTELNEVISSLDYTWSFKIIFVLGLGTFFKSYLWAFLIKKLGCKIKCLRLIAIWHYSTIGNYIPGSIWMHVGRIYSLAHEKTPKRLTAFSIAFEQIALLLTGLFTACLTPNLFKYAHLPPWIGFILLPAIAFVAFHPNLIGKWLWSKNFRKIDLRITPEPSKPVLLGVLSGYLLYFLLMGVALIFLLRLFDIPAGNLTILEASGFSAISFVIGYIAIFAPNGIGVKEGVLAYFLSNFTNLTEALLIAFAWRFLSIVTNMLFVFWAYLYFQFKKKESQTL